MLFSAGTSFVNPAYKITGVVGTAITAWSIQQGHPWWLIATECIVSLAITRYNHKYREDIKNAPPSIFPDVPPEVPPPTDPETKDKFLLIGAGFVGLGLAAGLKRHGIPYDQVEKEENVGGNWRYGVYDTVHIISSKKTTEFKDWPMPADYPDFPSAAQMKAYLTSYAEHYRLRDHLSCSTSVDSCVPINRGKDGWECTLVTADGKTVKRVYKGVICALGHHSCMRFPKYEGVEKFTGRFAHSKQIRSPIAELSGQRILVVGGGNSACDLATEGGRVGAKTCVSLRRGVWFIPRAIFGVPFVELVPPWMPLCIQRRVIKILCGIVWGSYTQYNLPEPETEPFDTHPTINSDLLQNIKLGRVSVRKAIKRFVGGKSVEFTDGTVEEFDLVICATGYNYSVPMLSDEVLKYKDGIPQLYGAFPASYYNVLVTVGGQPRYGAGPLISQSAQAIGYFIKAQEKLKNPLGDVMKAAGEKIMTKSKFCADVIADPHDQWVAMRKVPGIAAKLPTVEKWLTWRGKLPIKATSE